MVCQRDVRHDVVNSFPLFLCDCPDVKQLQLGIESRRDVLCYDDDDDDDDDDDGDDGDDGDDDADDDDDVDEYI